jgi:beta-N-acetylhexosaminidase
MSPPLLPFPINTTTDKNFQSGLVDTGEAILQSHYVVRNSSTQALFGFCATYTYPSRSLGVLAALFVDPSKRNLSIGHSLHQRAIRGLLSPNPKFSNLKIQTLQLGSSLPNIFPGIPMSDLTEGARLKRWFAANGWDISSPRLLYTLTIRNLSHWAPPEGLLANIQRVSFAFDLIHGRENAASVLEHVSTHSGPEVLALYNLALSDEKSCGVVRAKSPVDGSLVGTVIITRPSSSLSVFIPVLNSTSSAGNGAGHNTLQIGGILAPVVPNTPQAAIVLQGLALLGIRQNKAHKSTACTLCWVQGEERDVLLGMGFDVLDAFEELRGVGERVS